MRTGSAIRELELIRRNQEAFIRKANKLLIASKAYKNGDYAVLSYLNVTKEEIDEFNQKQCGIFIPQSSKERKI